MPRRSLTDEQVQLLYARYRATSLTLAQVAAEAGISINTLVGEFMRAGLARKTQADYPAHPPHPRHAGQRHQAHRDARRLTHDGATRTVAEWAAHAGIPVTTIYRRLAQGWSVAEALSRSVRPRHREVDRF